MSKTIAIVGAGPGLGLAVARAFGARGFRAALVARDADRLRSHAAEPAARGITAAGFPADVRDRTALVAALGRVREEYGPIDVLEYGPGPQGAPITAAVDTTAESAGAQFELNVLGAITAVRAVLPDMTERGEGTILVTTGVSSIVPVPVLGDVGLAMAGLRNWALALAPQLAPRGVHVAAVTIATRLVAGEGEGDPDRVAARYVRLHDSRDRHEEIVGDVEAFRQTAARLT
ncbi:SDR family NAD(P)-dependent oxidoreductase [Microbispora sp. NPDC088329]|uniref:SDR family NAD(P)-dependent oxidoreductase n=1 Tax=Microbispora sp. NPDC088329 TaxID=3154869 RepID=UPI00341F3DE5